MQNFKESYIHGIRTGLTAHYHSISGSIPVLQACAVDALKLIADTVFFWQALLEKAYQRQYKLCSP